MGHFESIVSRGPGVLTGRYNNGPPATSERPPVGQFDSNGPEWICQDTELAAAVRLSVIISPSNSPCICRRHVPQNLPDLTTHYRLRHSFPKAKRTKPSRFTAQCSPHPQPAGAPSRPGTQPPQQPSSTPSPQPASTAAQPAPHASPGAPTSSSSTPHRKPPARASGRVGGAVPLMPRHRRREDGMRGLCGRRALRWRRGAGMSI